MIRLVTLRPFLFFNTINNFAIVLSPHHVYCKICVLKQNQLKSAILYYRCFCVGERMIAEVCRKQTLYSVKAENHRVRGSLASPSWWAEGRLPKASGVCPPITPHPLSYTHTPFLCKIVIPAAVRAHWSPWQTHRNLSRHCQSVRCVCPTRRLFFRVTARVLWHPWTLQQIEKDGRKGVRKRERGREKERVAVFARLSRVGQIKGQFFPN